MLLLGRLLWWILLILSTCGLEDVKDGDDEVTCSQGLSDCTMTDHMLYPRLANSGAAEVLTLTAHVQLCCKDTAPCTLCMRIDMEMKINEEDEKDSRRQEENSQDTSYSNTSKDASVKVCYATANTMAVCKKVEFRVKPAAVTQQKQPKISIVVTQPRGVTFSSHVMVYSSKNPGVCHNLVVPSLSEVCSQETWGRLEECEVPKLSVVINTKTNQVDLRSADGHSSLPSVCVQYEPNGRCQSWNRSSLPLHAVMPCTCFEVWKDGERARRRLKSCPFNSSDFIKNVWQKVSLTFGRGQMNDGHPMLWWNLSAPCRLEGEVWPCRPVWGCTELQGFRQLLRNGTWSQNREGRWERTGTFDDLNLQLPACLMIKVRGRDSVLGPYCSADAAGRWRWSLLVVGVMLLLCLAVLMSYLLVFVKKWVWSWRHGRFIKIGRRGPVLLLSPPDVDEGVSESLRGLSSLLRHQGFSVTLDSWSRKEQWQLGPMPWLHSQMMELKRGAGRAVLVLTHTALERAQEWVLLDKTMGREGDHPHSAVFTASLFLIHSDRQRGGAGERFLLVTFDSDLCRTSRRPQLPQLLWGLQLFQLPSQTKALLTELSVGGTHREAPWRTRGHDPTLSRSELL